MLTGLPVRGRAEPRVVVVGDAGLDVVVRADALPAPGGDTRARITVGPGGAGANTAAWLAACGADPTLVARVGADHAAHRLRAELAAAGVRCAFAVDDAPTCQVVVLVDGAGQRTMLADRGAAALLAPDDIPAALAGAVHLHLSGYVLLDPSSRAAGRAALTAARAAGLSTSVDPQAAALLADPADFLADIAGVDLLLPSAAELAALGDAARDAVGAIAVTRGAGGASWIDRTTRVDVPAEPVAVTDSTGAGDAFDAGLLAAWLAGASPYDALRAGVRAATRAVTRLGARP